MVYVCVVCGVWCVCVVCVVCGVVCEGGSEGGIEQGWRLIISSTLHN